MVADGSQHIRELRLGRGRRKLGRAWHSKLPSFATPHVAVAPLVNVLAFHAVYLVS